MHYKQVTTLINKCEECPYFRYNPPNDYCELMPGSENTTEGTIENKKTIIENKKTIPFWCLLKNDMVREMEDVVFDKLSVEDLAKEIHKVYCKYHLEIKGSEYWTKGNYDFLDNKTKEADRYMARFILANFIHNQSVDKNKKSCTEIVGSIYLDILKIQRRLDRLEQSNKPVHVDQKDCG